MRAMKRIMMFVGLMGITACGGPEVPEPELASTVEEAVPLVERGDISQGLVTWRSDQVAEITPAHGFWGSWSGRVYCNEGMWADGYRMRVESPQGLGDDTALNSVKLYCWSPTTGASEEISSHDGLWGSWGNPAWCPDGGDFLSGARVRMEGLLGGGDDTSATDAEFSCRNGGSAHASNGLAWGEWGSWNSCPAGSAVCGLSIRFESSQGGGDDTAMNGLQLYCCSL